MSGKVLEASALSRFTGGVFSAMADYSPLEGNCTRQCSISSAGFLRILSLLWRPVQYLGMENMGGGKYVVLSVGTAEFFESDVLR